MYRIFYQDISKDQKELRGWSNEVYTVGATKLTSLGWSPKFAAGLNVIIGIDQKTMRDQVVLLPK